MSVQKELFPVDKIFNAGEENFNSLSLEIFRFQYDHNSFYRDYCNLQKRNPDNVIHTTDIPFLPVQFFKTKEIKTTEFDPQIIFESSGTANTEHSRHFVKDTGIYERSFTKCFEDFYGSADNFCILGLLPNYLEKGNSSLVYMVDRLIKKSRHALSGFYKDDLDKLKSILEENESKGQLSILFGVSYALLDFAEKYGMPLQKTVIIETGGMKGRRKEITREALHKTLKESFEIGLIHSEYSMTELLSQAYSYGEGKFSCPPWMKVLLRNTDDPTEIIDHSTMKRFQARGAINIIDLANIYSCSFIATDDAGILHIDGRFEVTGRLDNTDIRGCSQLADNN